MSLHAVDELTDAIDVTKEFLLPFDVRRWLTLALIVFFVGGGTGFPSYGLNFAQPSGGGDSAPVMDGGNLLLIAAVVVAVLLAIFVVFGIIGAILEFAFVQSLVTGDVGIRRYWSEYLRRGLRLFGFRVVVTLPLVLVVLLVVAAFVFPVFLGTGGIEVGLVLLLLAIPILFIGAFVLGIVNGFTTVFVVPVMLTDDCGVLDGWRTLWPSITDETVEYIGYAVINYVLRLVTGTGTTMVLGFAGLVLLIPFGGVALLVLAMSSATVSLLAVAVLAVVGLVYLLVMFAIWAVVLVPVETYHRYYALLVLGDIVPEYDLVTDRRPVDEDGFDGDGPDGDGFDGGGPGEDDFDGDGPSEDSFDGDGPSEDSFDGDGSGGDDLDGGTGGPV